MPKKRERYYIWTEDAKMCYNRKYNKNDDIIDHCVGCPLSLLDTKCELIKFVLKIFARCGAPKETVTHFTHDELEAFRLMIVGYLKKDIDAKIKKLSWQQIYKKLGLNDDKTLYTYKYERACAIVEDLVNNEKISLNRKHEGKDNPPIAMADYDCEGEKEIN